MNNLLNLMFVMLLMACNEEIKPKDFDTNLLAPEMVTVGFYNVENLFDTKDDAYTNDNDFTPSGTKQWTEDRYFTKLSNISKVINTMNTSDWPIIVGLAEIENDDVLEDLTKEKDLIDAN